MELREREGERDCSEIYRIVCSSTIEELRLLLAESNIDISLQAITFDAIQCNWGDVKRI